MAGVAGIRINALLSTGDVCAQQDNADKMIDFAKSSGVKNLDQDALVAAAIAYRKHPRNAKDIGGGLIPSIPQNPYCTKNPRNQELVGVVNEQLLGINPPVVAFGASMSCCLFIEVAQPNGSLYVALAQPARHQTLRPVLAHDAEASTLFSRDHVR